MQMEFLGESPDFLNAQQENMGRKYWASSQKIM